VQGIGVWAALLRGLRSVCGCWGGMVCTWVRGMSAPSIHLSPGLPASTVAIQSGCESACTSTDDGSSRGRACCMGPVAFLLFCTLYAVSHAECCITCCMLHRTLHAVSHAACCIARCVLYCTLYAVLHAVCCIACCMLYCTLYAVLYAACCITHCML